VRDLLAVHSVDQFAIGVPDLTVARHFFENFGLEIREEPGALLLHTFGHPHQWGRVVEAPSKRLQWLRLGVHEGELDRFRRRLIEHGVPLIDAPRGAPTGGLWCRGPDGLALNLVVAPKSSPSAPAPRVFPTEPVDRGRSPVRSATSAVKPLHLSHILLFTADVDASIAFYCDVLGLRLADRSGSLIAFLHSPHGSDHHLIALAHSDGPGLHHSSWTVTSLDDVGLGSQQMAVAGYAEGWGVGRHVLGSNYFRYVRDPWGSYAEYSFDIDFIPPGMQWPSADYAAEDSFYVWGPSPPPDFAVNYESEPDRAAR